jgi:hypothetical protein
MNLLVQPSYGLSVLEAETELSTARIEVVPTAHICLRLAIPLLTTSHASCVMRSSS